jgi:hypothetical protein
LIDWEYEKEKQGKGQMGTKGAKTNGSLFVPA